MTARTRQTTADTAGGTDAERALVARVTALVAERARLLAAQGRDLGPR